VVLGARPNTVAWNPSLGRLPARLATLVPESFLIIHPTEAAEPREARRHDGLPGFFARARIVSELPGRSAHAALDALLERHYPRDLGRRRDVLRMLLHGEAGGGLELAPGVAVAHARLDSLKAPLLFLGRSANGVKLPGIERPCQLVFLLLSPADRPDDHLAALADIARLMTSTSCAEALRAAATEEEMVAALGEREGAAAPTG
jgi:mannitol/fructose-specific phosphotransferase system IIA component (Ntr-type)